MPGRSGVTPVSVERFDAQPLGAGEPTRATPETMVSDILKTPTIWMDLDVEPAGKLELPFPGIRRLTHTPAQTHRQRPAVGNRRLRGLLHDADAGPIECPPSPGGPLGTARFPNRSTRPGRVRG